ncbi:MAG: YraN family protein [Isosphaeraceae bacterium]|nr:YraN family protein [Isosphaeraceae bacterium]
MKFAREAIASILRRFRKPELPWNLRFGAEGERAAERFVRKRLGYSVIARNFRTTRGELDLVAIDGKVVVVIEVKTRRSGDPLLAVTHAKQRRVGIAARQFARKRKLRDHPMRFDVITVLWPEGEREPLIEHIRHAFTLDER